MITELIVTSAPRGLQAGRSGFTTVCRTRGIHPELASRLEAASGYRHVYPQGDPRNPIVFSYTSKPSTAGEVWVMSRISDAGTDYTGRSNKIAHHVAIPPADLASLVNSNPAAVMVALAASGGLMSLWQGEPRENAAPPRLPSPASQPARCERWAAIAGDAGWAGVLVERALNKEVTWVVAPPGTDLLALFSEALALVNPSQRWQIPFTTYSLRGDEGRWLGTVAGSAEAEAAIAQKRFPVIDLTKRATAPTSSPYVMAARGETAVPWLRPGSTGSPPRAPLSTASPHSPAQPLPATLSGDPRSPMGLPPVLSRPAPLPHAKPPEYGEWVEVELTPRRSGRVPLLLAIAATIVAATALGVWAGCQFDVFPKAWIALAAGKARNTDPPTTPGGVGSGGDAAAPPVPPSESVTESKKKGTTVVTTSGSSLGDAASTKSVVEQTSQPSTPSPAPTSKTDTSPDFMELLLVEAGNNHRPKGGLQAIEKGSKAILIGLKGQARKDSLKDVYLKLPVKDTRLGLEQTKADENGEVRWACKQGDASLGMFSVTPTGIAFESQVPAEQLLASGLPFMPLVITGSHSGDQKTAWVQLFSAERKECITAGNGKPGTVMQFAIADATPLDGLVNARLMWNSLKVSAVSGTTQLLLAVSPTQDQDFKITSDIALEAGSSSVNMTWCPRELLQDDSKSSTYFEKLTIGCVAQLPLSVNLDASFNVDDFLVADAAEWGPPKSRLKDLSRKDKMEDDDWSTVCKRFVQHCVQIDSDKWPDEPQKKVKLFTNATSNPKALGKPALRARIGDLRSRIADLASFDDYVRKKVGTPPPDPGAPPVPPVPPVNGNNEQKKQFEDKQKEYLDKRKVWDDKRKPWDAYQRDVADKKLDPWIFRNWGEQVLLGSKDETIENKLLFSLWWRLHTYRVVTAGGYHFPVEEKKDGNQDSKSLQQLADEAQLQLSGQLVVRWNVDDFKPPLSGEPLDVLLVDIPACPPAGK